MKSLSLNCKLGFDHKLSEEKDFPPKHLRAEGRGQISSKLAPRYLRMASKLNASKERKQLNSGEG